ncbi:uncharacterized protein LOC123680102 [Harmonia axyridis]|uniref:uncharacterized protein LOC123680102 n=1 Tax=Harmonia axyridis TaxID=115357 RepID=UPI001E2777B4|nr:uncharacterized protein LOC123680102 [Harmonia axyridis]
MVSEISYEKNSFIQPIAENELSKNTNSIFSSLELTNNDFKTLSNNATTQNNNTEENSLLSNDISNSRVMSQMEVIVSPDLFIQPITISKRKQKTHVNTKANIQEKNGTKEHVHTATHNPEFIIRNYDHVENFNRLSLERSENNTSMEYFTQPPIEKEESYKVKLKDFQIPSNAEKISSCLINNIESEEMSDNSEIYIFNDMNSFPNVETDKGNNNCVMYDRDYEICNETKHNKDSHSFVKKQSPIHTNTLTKDHTLQESSREKAKDLKKYNVTISENKSCHSNTLNETKQSEINLDHLDISSSQGVKRRFLDSSTDLKMINGNIISTTENVLVENYSIASSEKISSTSETLISCNKTLDELSKELQEATKECSEVWEDYINLLNESKKELAKSKNTSISEYNNGKLKFPPGYEDHYKYLDEVLFEFKSTIGIPNNINQTENNIISFEDTMNDWQELQQIVQRIIKCEKKKKNFNCTLKNNKV